MTVVQSTPLQWPNAKSRSAALFERAVRVLPGGNSRSTVFFQPFPAFAASGSGAFLTDADGVSRLDAVNNYSVLIHGHAHPAITEAVTRQLAAGTALGMPTEVEVEFAELLCARVPAFERIRFTNSGTEAVMVAIKAARAFTGRPAIAKAEGGSHGGYDYVDVSRAPQPHNWGGRIPNAVPDAPGITAGVASDVVVFPANDAALTEEILTAHRDRIAAVIFDPVLVDCGLAPVDPAYLRMLREVTRRHGMLLILDEVVSFRCGPAGLQGAIGLQPDLTALGKSIGGGLPVGAVAGRAEIMGLFDQRRGRARLKHGGSSNAHPLTMAAGLATMRLLDPSAYDRLNAAGARLHHALSQAFRDSGCPGQVTAAGSLLQLHFQPGAIRDYRSAFPTPAAQEAMAWLFRYLLDHGVFVAPFGLLALSTPMTDADIDRLSATIAAGLHEYVATGAHAALTN
jgi:glutamate-1-semialdehyde 2,1-aminomutase